MRGSVGRAFASAKRYKEDEEWREKQKERRKKYDRKNKEKVDKRHKEWVERLNEFRNRKCKKCDKLLNYRTKGYYCIKHFQRGKKKNEK